MIAEMVGVRQASLYYHFSTKEQILAELLESTVGPSLAYAGQLAREALSPAEALRALVRYDVGILLGARWNVGILYALPEIATEPFARFRAEREQLRLAYRRLVAAVAASAGASSADASSADASSAGASSAGASSAGASSAGASSADASSAHPDVIGDLVFGMVESVIGMRRDLPALPPPDQFQQAVAAAALRLATGR
jgi:AcrR family transcriptional regulator